MKTIGDLIDALSVYDRNLPFQAVVMDAGFEINGITLEEGWGIETNENTPVVCINVSCELPLFIP